MENSIKLAKQAGFDTINDKVYVFAGQHNISVELELYTTLVRNAALEEALNCYSPDDTAADYLEKIEDLKEPTP